MVVNLTHFWDPEPTYTAIVELLEKKQGALTDAELYKALKADREDFSLRDLNRALMKLEVDGIVHVFDLTKNKRRIELIRG